MITFEQTLTDGVWVELLNGGSFLAFDKLSSKGVQVLFTEDDTSPADSTDGNSVNTWAEDWDFMASDMLAGTQRIWVKGSGDIRGVR